MQKADGFSVGLRSFVFQIANVIRIFRANTGRKDFTKVLLPQRELRRSRHFR